MFKENPIATVLFILVIIGLIAVLAYTPFYLKGYKEDLNRQHELEKEQEQKEIEKNNQEELEKADDNEPDKDDDENKAKEDEDKVNKEDENSKEPINLELIIEVNKTKYKAKLEDNETTRAFLKKLPLEITMNELNGNEKYYRFDNSLPSNPTSVDKINKGDLMLYEDDTLVLFYDTFDTPYKYTKIGNISDNAKLMTNLGKDKVTVKFSQEKKE